MRPFFQTCYLIGLSVAALGCSGGGRVLTTPTATTPPAHGREVIAARYTVTLDPAALTATLTPHRTAAQQPPQALTYDLDPGRFLKSTSLVLTHVTRPSAEELAIGFRFTHPYGAPDFDQDPTFANRADLGITGRLVILADRAHLSYFGGEVTCDPSLVAEPDGFVTVGDLLYGETPTNNTFPYMLLADEAKDNRPEESNGGVMTGDYLSDPNGWQRANWPWTGYDYVHCGQTVENEFRVRQAALTPPYTFDVAVMVQFTEPKGEKGRTHPELRFPPESPDPTQFAYRLPFAALDASVSSNCGGLEITSAAGHRGLLHTFLRDWDAGATEAADADLSDETDVHLIQPGAAGAPIAEIDCPQLASSPASLTLGVGTGLPGDEFQYEGYLENTIGGVAPGQYAALVRFTDPEQSDPSRTEYHFGLDPVTIQPSPWRAIPARTYHAVPITVTHGAGWVRTIGGAGSEGLGRMATTAAGEVLVLGGYLGSALNHGTVSCPEEFPAGDGLWLTKYDAHGNRGWTRVWETVEGASFTGIDVDGDGNIYVSGHFFGTFDPDPGPGEIPWSDEGDTDALLLSLDPDGDYRWGATWGATAADYARDVLVSSPPWLYVCGQFLSPTIDLDPGPLQDPRVSVGGGDMYVSQFNTTGGFLFSFVWGSEGHDSANALASDGLGGYYFAGSFHDLIDFDPLPPYEPATSNGGWDAFICKIDEQPRWQWTRAFGGNGEESVTDLNVANGVVIALGSFQTSVDFNPGGTAAVRTAAIGTDAFITRHTSNGAFGMAVALGGLGTEYLSDVTQESDGDLVVVGAFEGTVDFDPGNGTVPRTAAGYQDALVWGLTANGALRWIRTLGGGDADRALAITAGSSSGLLIGGAFSGATDFDPGTGVIPREAYPPVGFYDGDAFLLRWDTDGNW